MLTRVRTTRDNGYTLVELLVSMVIITAVLTAFTVFLLSMAGTQRTASMTRTGERVLAAEVERTASVRWDDLMMRPAGTYADCDLPDDSSVSLDRRSVQVIAAGPETQTLDGITFSVTRNVKWKSDGVTVSCTTTNNAKDRGDLKVVTVTVSWNDGTVTRTKTATVYRSRWAESPVSPVAPQGYGTLVTSPAVDSTTGWNATYNRTGTNETGALGTNVTVASNPTAIKAIFYDTGERTVGVLVTGLTVGKTYIAVMSVMAPNKAGSVPLNLDVVGVGRGGIALANGTYYTISNTWTEGSATSRVIGASPDPSYTRTSAEAYITGLKVYQLN